MQAPDGYDLYLTIKPSTGTIYKGWFEHELAVWHVEDEYGKMFTYDIKTLDIEEKLTKVKQKKVLDKKT